LVRPEKKEIGIVLPLFTAVIIGIALLVFLVPSLAGWLVYDRREIWAGQVWRLFTGNLVHFSQSHLVFNLLVFGVVGWAIERRGYGGFRLFCLLSACAIGVASYTLSPDMAQYGGLSGIACGAILFLALYGLSEKGFWRIVCAGAFLLTTCKIGLEFRLGRFLFVNSTDGAFLPVPLSHAVGALTAIIVFGLVKGRKKTCLATEKGGQRLDEKDILSHQ
jgi:rhomboid family GlyGly-CTERM serine protease